MALKELKAGDAISAESINQIIRALNASAITVGPGLQIKRTASGTVISSGRQKAPRGRASRQADELPGDTIQLAAAQGVQDTDDYDRERDQAPVELQVITDVRYDDTTGELTYRTRTITTEYFTSVSDESDEVLITTAEVCP